MLTVQPRRGGIQPDRWGAAVCMHHRRRQPHTELIRRLDPTCRQLATVQVRGSGLAGGVHCDPLLSITAPLAR